jgi:hypothetical protein
VPVQSRGGGAEAGASQASIEDSCGKSEVAQEGSVAENEGVAEIDGITENDGIAEDDCDEGVAEEGDQAKGSGCSATSSTGR